MIRITLLFCVICILCGYSVYADPLDSYHDGQLVTYGGDSSQTRVDYAWWLENTGQSFPFYTNGVLKLIDIGGSYSANFKVAWSTTPTSSVPIGVIDIGVNTNHLELIGVVKKWVRYNFRYTVPNDLFDPTGHGTHKVGLLSAIANNGIGTRGICQSPIYFAKCRMSDDQASPLTALNAGVDEIATAIRWQLANGVRLIYLPWGTSHASDNFSNACWSIGQSNALLICAVPDSPISMDTTIDFPTSYHFPWVIPVTGLGPQGNVTVSATGSNVFGAPGDFLIGPDKSSLTNLVYYRGSSGAAAIMTGALALLMERFPHQSNLAYVEALKHSPNLNVVDLLTCPEPYLNNDLSIVGLPFWNYTLEFSTNLIDWQTVSKFYRVKVN